jgi:hypothetical protein
MRLKRKPADYQAVLLDHLIEMGDTLQAVSMAGLEARGGWDQALFDQVLDQIEAHTPVFQTMLLNYLTHAEPRAADRIAALLAVDRLSTAYTYWTRLFPPGKQDQTMFVLSLLHDLSDKVEYAIELLQAD